MKFCFHDFAEVKEFLPDLPMKRITAVGFSGQDQASGVPEPRSTAPASRISVRAVQQ